MRKIFLFAGVSMALAIGCASGFNDNDDDGGPSGSGGDTTAPTSTGVGGAGGDPATTGTGGDPSTASSTAQSSSAQSTAQSSSASTSVSSTAVSSSAVTTVTASSTGGGCPIAPPTNLSGCPSCGAFCDSPWPAAWSASAGATHYIVEYQCFTQISSYQTPSTSVDLCNEVGMCNNGLCANGAGPVTIKACDSQCCSAAAQVPTSETPIACGGGVCC